jgi:parvulin-like peptidyl-prolyl isomerase
MLESRLMNTPYQEFANTALGKRQFVDWIVRETIIVESAKKDGVDKQKDYKQALSDFKEQQKRQYEEYRDNLLVELYFRDIQQEIIVQDADIESYYNIHKQEFDAPTAYTVRHILTMDNESADKAYEEIQKGTPFEKVVGEYSQDPASAHNGGLVGPFKKGELTPEFEKVAIELSIGQVSAIVETPYGYHIILKVSQRSLPAMSFEEASLEIRRTLEREKFEGWFEAKRQELKVKVNYNTAQ